MFSIMCQGLEYYFEHFKITMKYSLIFVYSTCPQWPVFPHSVHVETVVLLSHKKPDGHINVKVEFGEGEGKVPLDNIAKRA